MVNVKQFDHLASYSKRINDTDFEVVCHWKCHGEEMYLGDYSGFVMDLEVWKFSLN